MESLVSTEWLANEMGASDLRIVDATLHLPAAGRDAAAEYLAGHIPGAVFVSLVELVDAASPVENTMPSAEKFASRMQALGLGDGSRIVIYDDSAVKTSARAWFMFRKFGAHSVALLDGGLAKWKAEGRPLAAGTESLRQRHFTVWSDERNLRSKEQLSANIASHAEQVIDARSAARFTGDEADPRPGIALGHIPGSLNLPYGQMFNLDGTWKDKKGLMEAFANAGIDLSHPVVATCGSGITACVLLFAMHLLGKHDASLYDGSWTEWGGDPGTPKRQERPELAGGKKTDKPATRLVTLGRRKEWTGAVVNPPVWRASTHLYESAGDLAKGRANQDGNFYYGRRGAPTQWALADALTQLEPGAGGTMLYPSGVAAVAGVLLSLLRPGDVLLMADNAYEPTRNIGRGWLAEFGIGIRFFDPMNVESLREAMCDNSRVALFEAPGSLTMEVPDMTALFAAARSAGLVSVFDNTWASPLGYPALERGADISVMSLTKHVGGHSDLMMGSASASSELYTKLRRTAQSLGQVVSPDDASLALRGLRTLGVRLTRETASALEIARWLSARPEVAKVMCPMLPGSPGHEYWSRDFTGGCGLFSFVFRGGDVDARSRFIDALELFGIGFSWGGFESLVVPVDPAPIRSVTRWPFPGMAEQDRFGVRLSIGLEDPADLVADLEAGLRAWSEG